MSGFELRFVQYIILTPFPFTFLICLFCGGGAEYGARRTLPSGRLRHPDISYLGSRVCPSSVWSLSSGVHLLKTHTPSTS